MAKTSGKIMGDIMGIYVNDTLITCGTSATLTINNETVDTTCKDGNSPPTRTYEAGVQDWSMAHAGNAEFDQASNLDLVAQLVIGATEFTAKFASSNSDDPYWQGQGYISAFTFEGPISAPSTWNITISPKGPISYFNT